MPDASKGTIRWMRKRHPVGTTTGALDIGVRLTNIGTAPASTWESPDYVVRAHVHAADGTYLANPTVEGESFVDPVAVDATTDHVVTIVAPASGGASDASAAQLFHPDTLIVADVYDVVNDLWLGSTAPGEAGQMYVRDSMRDRPVEFRESAQRRRMIESIDSTITVPASGLESDILFFQQVSGSTAYLEEIVLSPTKLSVVDVYVRDQGMAEEQKFTLSLDSLERLTVTDIALDPGDWIRVAVRPSSDPGEVTGRLTYVNLPWEDEP